MLIGYCRVSTADQSLDLQIDALKAAGVERIFTDKASGVREDRPGLTRALAALHPGDVLVAWKLDRIARSLRHLVELVNDLEKRGVGLRILTQAIDTTSPSGKLVFHIFGAISEFERQLIQERTLAGLAAAKARGRKGGRRKKLTPERIAYARALLADPKARLTNVAAVFGVSRATLYRALAD